MEASRLPSALSGWGYCLVFIYSPVEVLLLYLHP